MDIDKNNNESGHDKSSDDNCVVRQKDETVSLDQTQQQPAKDDPKTSSKNSTDQDPEEQGERKNKNYSQNETLDTKKTPPSTLKDPPQVPTTTSESSATEGGKASATSGTIHCPVKGCPQTFSAEKYVHDHIAQTKGKAHKKYRQQQTDLGSGGGDGGGKDDDDDDDSSNKQGEKRPLADKQEGDYMPPAQKKACAPLVYRTNLHEPFGFGRRY
jgi:hypothetical protein